MNQTLPPFQLTSKRYPYNAYTIESAIEREQAIAQRLEEISESFNWEDDNIYLSASYQKLIKLIKELEGAK